jgi:hypothetical protein
LYYWCIAFCFIKYRTDDDHPHAVDQHTKEDQDAFGDLLYELIGSPNIDKDSGIRKNIE